MGSSWGATFEWSGEDFAVTFPEGWTVQYGHVYHRKYERGTAELYAIDLDQIYTDACHGEGIPQALGPAWATWSPRCSSRRAPRRADRWRPPGEWSEAAAQGHEERP